MKIRSTPPPLPPSLLGRAGVGFGVVLALLCVACAKALAQATPNAVRVHLNNGAVEQFAITGIKSMKFKNVLTVSLQSGNKQQFDCAKIDSFTFAKVADNELYEAVDMGLSVRWATCNVGASKPEGYGNLYAWGETTTKSNYTEATYAYYQNSAYTYIGVNICGTNYDAARKTWGGQWRLPTRSEIRELMTQCTWTAETLNGTKGYRVTAANGNSIFLPAAGYQNGTTRKEQGTTGYYWSGSLDRSLTSSAYNINFRGYNEEWTANRAYGFSVRAVK